jgi:hypothetical protein
VAGPIPAVECINAGCGVVGWGIATVSAADPLPGPEDVARAGAKSGYFVRFGKAAETAEELGKDAADARAAGYPHGVSVRAKPAVTNAERAKHRVADASEANAEFTITQTGKDKRHHTVEVPDPVTQEFVDKFHKVFK